MRRSTNVGCSAGVQKALARIREAERRAIKPGVLQRDDIIQMKSPTTKRWVKVKVSQQVHDDTSCEYRQCDQKERWNVVSIDGKTIFENVKLEDLRLLK